uniref:TTF-type domain-containing protein n=1 Tax=Astyanax mexicanus TaxID=7994 RepID=A0A3B1K7X7_ASTMX
MKRSYPSGAQKRRKIKERKSSTQSLTKLTNFFLAARDEKSDEDEVPETARLSEEDAAPVAAEVAGSSVSLHSSPQQSILEETVSARCEIIKRGPVQIKEFDFPQNNDKIPRRFTVDNYHMKMNNGEKINRNWLVYSLSSDSVFCFCCTVFERESKFIMKKSKIHRANMQNWRELAERLKTVQHRKAVLRRILAIVCHLAERNQALRGHSEKLFEPHNGNFLGQIELMAQLMSEHLRRIDKKEIKDHYLSKTIQNELISLVGQKTKDAIVQKVKDAKYFSVIMDCTPDTSHNEQMSLVLRIVNCESCSGASISEHFVGFFSVQDTSGRGLCNTLTEELKHMKLNIADCRGQSYNNGSNMMGHKQGVQKRVLEINQKALCVPCSSHSLNLVVADAAKSSVLSVTFFGILQWLYNLFSSSVHRWSILQRHVKLTVKNLSTTRWECRIESVKALRHQYPEMIEALSVLTEHAAEKKDGETLYSAQNLCKELMSWQFILCVVIWYNVLFHINHVSKLLQKPELFSPRIPGSWNFIAKTEARELQRNYRRTTRKFLYEGKDEVQLTPEQRFNQDVFLPLIDTALISISERFTQVDVFFSLFGFLYYANNMKKAIQEDTLEDSCKKLERTLGDVDSQDLVLEVTAAVSVFPDHISSPADILDYIYKENLLELYGNLSIALRLLLTLPITVASGERSFSSLKLIKNFLRSTMSQERLTGLAMISIEQRVRRSLNMEDIINAFAETKTRMVQF